MCVVIIISGNNLITSDSLKIEIWNVTSEIMAGELECMSQNLLHQCEMCLDAEGYHFQWLL